MKTLIIDGKNSNGNIYQAEKIIKGSDYIIGYNEDPSNPVFSMLGLRDMSLFLLADGEEFDTPELTKEDALLVMLTDLQLEIGRLKQVIIGGK